MSRIRDLINAVTKEHPDDRFFKDFDESCRINPAKKAAYRAYQDAVQLLDQQSWQVLKDKALKHFNDHRYGQRKQGFFNQLNEAFAYRYLVSRGHTEVTVLPECGVRTPDLRYVDVGERKHCEVKTLGLSDEEIKRREFGGVFSNSYHELGKGFFGKVESDVKDAKAQIAAVGTAGLVYIVLIFDDLTLDYYSEYRRQILSFCRDKSIDDVCFKVGLRGNRLLRTTEPFQAPDCNAGSASGAQFGLGRG